MRYLIISLCFYISSFILYNSQIYSQSSSTGVPARQAIDNVVLDVICAFDRRLPALSNNDLKLVLKEAKRIISIKLGSKIKIQFRDNGTISLEDFFKDKSYRKTDLYKNLSTCQYDINQGEYLPLFNNRSFRNNIIKFLRQWNLKSLRGFFPDKNIKDYEDVFNYLMNVYHNKVKWIKTLKLNDSENLIIEPFPPYQSYIEWICYMWNQDRYDIIFTNGFIFYDHLSEPYPHSICKHAKVGGSSFFSPKRDLLDGRSLMVNIFEEYGNVKGICSSDTSGSKKLKNKILGGFYFAHEFGHAFYMIPDVYDHGDTCLMNSSLQNLDNIKGYNLLIRDLSTCRKCQPWINAKETIIKAHRVYKNSDYNLAAELYIKGAKETPELIDGNYNLYIRSIYEKALYSFQKAGNKEGEQEIKKIIDDLNEKISE